MRGPRPWTQRPPAPQRKAAPTSAAATLGLLACCEQGSLCDNVLQESFEKLNCRKGALLFLGSFTCPSLKNLALTGWSCVEVAAQISKYVFSSAGEPTEKQAANEIG